MAWSQGQTDLAGAPADLVVAADGTAVLAGVSADWTRLIVQRFDSVTGTMHWQRERTAIQTPLLGSVHGPKLAIDGDTGLIRVAVSQEDDWLIVSYAEDGTAGPEILVGEPDHVDVPLAIVASTNCSAMASRRLETGVRVELSEG